MEILNFQNNGTINVTGTTNIGISAATSGTNTGIIRLGSGAINVTAVSFADGDIPIGVYAKGNNITISSVAGNITNRCQYNWNIFRRRYFFKYQWKHYF